jgi:hypothetical protein
VQFFRNSSGFHSSKQQRFDVLGIHIPYGDEIIPEEHANAEESLSHCKGK